MLPSLSACLISVRHAIASTPQELRQYGPYVGNLAGREVVAYFKSDAQGSPVEAAYFYRDTGKDIVLFHDALQGRFIECRPTWQEEETFQGCSDPSGYWNVQLMRNADRKSVV